MTPGERERFDALLREVLEDIPAGVRDLLEEVPVVVEDEPSRRLLIDMGEDPDAPDAAESLCGLHTGHAFTERSVEASGELPSNITLFRRGIVAEAGGWREAPGDPDSADDRVYEQIWITLLHEVGHQFGLDEDDLEQLGYQ